MIDGEVALELKGKVFVLHAGDSARDQSTVPYSWSDNGGKEAVFVQVGAPRLF
nr:cupin domain-containing protein [Burkholderia aenigmatica]